MYRAFLKRVLDILASGLALIILSPIIIFLTLISYFAHNRQPFFRQRRPGKDMKEIYVLKFKSMNDNRDSSGQLLPDKERITSIGNFLRNTSLDELPQLINVLKGDMSLIGPRPLLFDYIPLYQNNQALRHEVRPGITGWAQVNGRNSITWTQKFAYDVTYVQNLSFLFDLKILFLTIKKVFVREGITSDIEQVNRRFNGFN